ncbi:hypothetical protein B0O95_112112 [Mycetohabitans endofungorum]|uniref:Uncharacterized protein n=1 Tax=Mycetohabitans endofungorum TaxID=417203 RepID=A0A2P5K8J3_9BURK|nr:hypothetical protein B0O95_112112 [Mycetohabitans endofungorum]
MLNELACEFKPTAQNLINRVMRADRHTDMRHDGTTTAERQELTRLSRNFRQPAMERDILSYTAAWFARETKAAPPEGYRLIKVNRAR